MMGLLKYFYHKTAVGNLLLKQAIKVYNFFWTRVVDDEVFIKREFKKRFGREINLKKPQSLNEKINWLKLNDKNPLQTICADKYAVRNYIESNIGDNYLVPLYFQTKEPKEIIPRNIPDSPCIIKTNHDSGGGIIIKDKKNIDWAEVQDRLRQRMEKNYYHQSKEWQYKAIEPRIIVEKLLVDKTGTVPMDYKLHCFNGKVRMIQVDIGRDTDHHYRNWYNSEWIREPYKWSSPKENGQFTDPSIDDIAKPDTLSEMINLSNTLSLAFDYVRVDWYDVDGHLFFGELTFHHDSGLQPIQPEEWDYKLGAELKLTTQIGNQMKIDKLNLNLSPAQ